MDTARYTPRNEECEVCGCRYVCGFSKILDANGSPVGYRHMIEPGTLPVRKEGVVNARSEDIRNTTVALAEKSGRFVWVGVRGFKDSSSWCAGVQSSGKHDELSSFEVDADSPIGALRDLSDEYDRKMASLEYELERRLAKVRGGMGTAS